MKNSDVGNQLAEIGDLLIRKIYELAKMEYTKEEILAKTTAFCSGLSFNFTGDEESIRCISSLIDCAIRAVQNSMFQAGIQALHAELRDRGYLDGSYGTNSKTTKH